MAKPSHFVECNTLLHIMDGDDEVAHAILRTMYRGELVLLHAAAQDLAAMVDDHIRYEDHAHP